MKKKSVKFRTVPYFSEGAVHRRAEDKLNWPGCVLVAGCFSGTTMDSDAATFRFACGSVRRSPEYNTQRLPLTTPHVGQGTARDNFRINRIFFIEQGYDKTRSMTSSFF
jgi:hypothetical protein